MLEYWDKYFKFIFRDSREAFDKFGFSNYYQNLDQNARCFTDIKWLSDNFVSKFDIERKLDNVPYEPKLVEFY